MPEKPWYWYHLAFPEVRAPEELQTKTLKAMNELEVTLPEMARRLKGKVPRRTLYNYLSEGRRPKKATTLAIYQVLEQIAGEKAKRESELSSKKAAGEGTEQMSAE